MTEIKWDNEYGLDDTFNRWIKVIRKDLPLTFDIYELDFQLGLTHKLDGDKELKTNDDLGVITKKSFEGLAEKNVMYPQYSDTLYFRDGEQMIRDVAKAVDLYTKNSDRFAINIDESMDNLYMCLLTSNSIPDQFHSDRIYGRSYSFITMTVRKKHVLTNGFELDEDYDSKTLEDIKITDPIFVNSIYRVTCNGITNFVAGNMAFNIDILAKEFGIDKDPKIVSAVMTKVEFVDSPIPSKRYTTWKECLGIDN